MNGVGIAISEKVLGKAIANARHSADLTQQQLCSRAGLSYSTLAKIERGAIKSPSVFTVATIAEATGTSMEQLIGIQTAGGQKPLKKAYKTSKSGIKFVYFDVNGVLVHYYQRAFTMLAHDAGVEPDIVEAVFWHYNDAVCRGGISIKEFNSILATRIGIKKVSFTDYYLANVSTIQEVRELVLWAAKHYRVGIMTNIMPGMTKALLNENKIPNLEYEAIVDSSEVGAIKPEVKIYEQAVKLSGVNPEEILFIDDNRTNLMAAEKLGWRVLWFDDYSPKEGINRIKKLLEF